MSEQDKVVVCPPILVMVKEGGASTRVAKERRVQWGLLHGAGARSVRGRTTSNTLNTSEVVLSGSVGQWWFWRLPNKTKPLLQVLAVTVGKSEKNKVRIM